MFMWTLRRHSDLADIASALGPDVNDAMLQVKAYNPALLLRLSDDPQEATHYFEKRRAVPSPFGNGNGWMNDPRGPVDIVHVVQG